MSRPSLPAYLKRINEPWRDETACAPEASTDYIYETAWHSPNEATVEHAKLVCEVVCTVREKCLRDALTDPYAEGIRGGFQFSEGKVAKEDVRHIRRLAPDLYIRVKKTKRDQTIELDEAV